MLSFVLDWVIILWFQQKQITFLGTFFWKNKTVIFQFGSSGALLFTTGAPVIFTFRWKQEFKEENK